jgi:hypothetical protein
VLVKNILAFIFSAVLIDFDRKFINNPYFDYTYNNLYGYGGYGSSTLCSTDWSDSPVDFWSISVSLTKGQLAGAVIILVTSLIYVGIYIYVYIKALSDAGRLSKGPFAPSQPSTNFTEPIPDYSPVLSRSYGDSQTNICHNCGAIISLLERF